MYYELHITIERPSNKYIEALQASIEAGHWSFSCIDKDIVLGDMCYCYATKHMPARHSIDIVKKQLQAMAVILASSGWAVVREKIELVIYDSRQP